MRAGKRRRKAAVPEIGNRLLSSASWYKLVAHVRVIGVCGCILAVVGWRNSVIHVFIERVYARELRLGVPRGHVVACSPMRLFKYSAGARF